MPRIFVFAGALAAAASLRAQVAPDFISVDLQHVYVQTGAATTTAASYLPGNGLAPFMAVVSVEANSRDLSSNSAPTFTLPGASTYAGSTTLALNGTNWRRSNYYATSTPLLSEFPNGAYTVSVNSNTLSMNLSGDMYASAPVATITGGTGLWSGNTLTLSAGASLTITTSTFGWDGTGAETNGALANHIGLFVSHNGSEVVNAESFSNGADAYFNSGTANPNFVSTTYNFTSGQYFVEMEFNAISSMDAANYPGAHGVGLYTSRTVFNIEVVPEPAAYATFAGVLALAGVFVRRRRLA